MNTNDSKIGPDILPWIVDKIKPIIDNSVRFGDGGINDRTIVNSDSAMGLNMHNPHSLTPIRSKNPTIVMQSVSDLPNGTKTTGHISNLKDYDALQSFDTRQGSRLSTLDNPNNTNILPNNMNNMDDMGSYSSIEQNDSTVSQLDFVYKPITDDSKPVVESELKKDDYEQKYQKLLAERQLS